MPQMVLVGMVEQPIPTPVAVPYAAPPPMVFAPPPTPVYVPPAVPYAAPALAASPYAAGAAGLPEGLPF